MSFFCSWKKKKNPVVFAPCQHIPVLLTFKMSTVCLTKHLSNAVGTPVNANTTQCITADQHPPTRNKILLHLNEQLSSFHSLNLKLQHSLTACLRSGLMWTKGLERDVGFSSPSFAADLHLCSWNLFTLQKNVQTLLPLPAPLFSLCPCCMPHCLLFYSRWMLPPQLFVCFSSFYLCDSLQLLWTLVFIILPFPYKTRLLLMFCSCLFPIFLHLSPHIYLCAVPFCVSLLSSMQWKIQCFSSYW